MDHFTFRNCELYAEDVKVADIVKQYGSPTYIYSRATLERHWNVFDDAFKNHPHTVCYAVKSNGNIAILDMLARLGSGFDIVSIGELERVIAAGGDPKKIVFSGIGKQEHEIRRAIEVGIHCFNVESIPELKAINGIAGQLGQKANISIRVNPNVDAGTHPYITTGLPSNKFGINICRAISVYEQAAKMPNITIKGIAFHIGSQLTELGPFANALETLLPVVDELIEKGFPLQHIDIGGGLGVRYHDETPPLPHEYAKAMLNILGDRPLHVMLEPGRAISANAGLLVTKVEYLKHTPYHSFAIVDAGMNDMLRPSLYDAWHDILPALKRTRGESRSYDIVGPVCESGDFFGKHRTMIIEPNDLLGIRACGAYGFSMSSNYNARPRAAEVVVDGDQFHLVRRRETVEELFAGESKLPEYSPETI